VRSEVSRLDGVEVAVKADAFVSEVAADGVDGGRMTLDETEAESTRVRAALEGVREWALEGEAVLSGALELGVRLDGGDAESGAGADLAGELRYASVRHGLDVALQGSALLAHEDSGFEEWGVGLLLVYDPGAPGRGLRLSLSPAWNTPQSDVAEAMWDTEAGPGVRNGTTSSRGAALGVRLGYGLSARHGRARMTVYGEAGSDADASRLRLGTELRPTGAGRLGLQVYGERQDRQAGSEHALGLRLGLEF